MIIESGRSRIERYWSLEKDRVPGLRSLPYLEQVQALSDALAESVRLQMISDVPLGAFLSGGIDSSILVGLMAREAGKRIKTFSVGYEAEGAAIDESGIARETARFLGTDHHHVLVRGSDVRERILHIASALDQPSVDGVNSYFVSWAARQGMTVAISGTGGDELFAGYPWFLKMAMLEKEHRPFWAGAVSAMARQPVFDELLSTRFKRKIYSARMLSGFINQYALQYRIFGALGAHALLSSELHPDSSSGRAEYFDLLPTDELSHGSVVERVTGLCLRGYTLNQLLRDIDATSMSHSLEVRVPYLDTVLTDLALSLPDETKLNPGLTSASAQTTYRATGVKRILIDAGRSLLPKDFDIQPKRGFAMPFARWLSEPLRDVFLQALSDETVRNRGWFNVAETARIREDFIAGKTAWSQPWLLMMTELWASQVFDTSKN
jgi:asparagine synthase (glutamine-hydrolysing)